MIQHATTTSLPIPVKGTASVVDAVQQDLEVRRQFGRQKYGTELEAHNGRDALVDAYQEALDLALYLKQALLERDTVRSG